MKKYVAIIIFTAFIFSTNSCDYFQKNDSNYTFIKPTEIVNHDSFTLWILNPTHLLDTNYEKKYKEKVAQYIEKNQLDSAAEILKIIGDVISESNIAPSRFYSNAAYIHTFFNTYESKLSTQYKFVLVKHIMYMNQKIELTPYILKLESIEPKNYVEASYKLDLYRYLIMEYVGTGKLDSALSIGLKAKKLSYEIDKAPSKALVIYQLYTVYMSLGDYETAKTILNETRKIAENTKDSIAIHNCISEKVTFYQFTTPIMDNDTFGAYCLDVYNFYAKWQSPKIQYKFMAYYDYTNYLKSRKDNKNMLLYLDTLKQLSSQCKEPFIQELYNELNGIITLESNKTKLNDDLFKLIEYYKENNLITEEKSTYSILYSEFEERKDYKNAFKYLRLYLNLSDTLHQYKMMTKVKELDKKYETEKKNNEILFQKQTIRKNKILVLALILVIFGLILSFIAYTLNKQKKELQFQKELQNNYTMNLLQNTETERKRIATDLHDSVNQELVSLRNDTKTNSLEVNQKIDSLIEQVRIISRNLHPVLFESIGLKDSIIDLLERIQSQHKNIVFNYDIKYNNSLLSTDEIQIYRALQEAINNTIKYANAQAMMIKVEEKNQMLLVEIKDSGKGFDVEKKLKDKNSFGLLNIINRMKTLGGQTEFISNQNGTTILIKIALKK